VSGAGGLPVGSVVVFSGHMIDRAGRGRPRFPATRERAVAAAIARELETSEATVGIASGACGGDILFLEAMLARPGGEVTVVLPFDVEEFVQSSVRPRGVRGGREWERRFRTIVGAGRATVVFAGTSRPADAAASYARANEVVAELAAARGRESGTTPVGLAVWDGSAGGDPGGTGDAVRVWRRLGWGVRVIDPMAH
jgi:hypothetical protein